ncbi:helix-turn-helix transcriptional regulator [Actinoalloteichus hymeniacidonis]|uniref:Transcriptional regulator, luxR family n=1 Tax=Actinoalloteichus hymeniacidonis TaxID=340345 RepID=A0AAC9HRB6_9PSEU|nr:LuxR family transcriptional regulator [Actinoalloteichus hymeniacidonis]AOS63993.1 transcriptional regulator, luxR family [Actinoalloteichus hymeniacidonis]MBB5907948.1 DNA-binding CsgD family transcriptional regulator [Actinoalloteichus hymeniacidonis]
MRLLVERHDALETLNRLYAETAMGKGQVALVTGGPASGKTALMDVFTDQLADSGALLLTATGSRAEMRLQMGVIDQLFQSAEPSTGMRSLVTVSTTDTDDDAAAAPVDARVSHEVCDALLAMSRHQPVVIAVDDIQFADQASLQTLLYVRRRIRSTRLLMLLNEWAQPLPTQPLFRAEITRQPHERISLHALSRHGVAEVAVAVLGGQLFEREVDHLHTVSGGNPLLLHALIEDRTAEPDRADAATRVGAAFEHEVLACLHRWDSSLLDLAHGIALLGRDSSPELICQLLGIRAQAAAQGLETLTTAGLLHRQRFRHPVAQRVVLDSIPPDRQSVLHLSAAELLHRQQAGAVSIAEHLLATREDLPPWAVEVLRDAAEQVLLQDDLRTALRYLEQALQSCADPLDHTLIESALARVKWQLTPSSSMPHFAQLQPALRAGLIVDSAAVALVRSRLWQGKHSAVRELLATDSVNDVFVDIQARAELRLAYAWVYGPEPRKDVRPDALDDVFCKQGEDEADATLVSGNPWAQAIRALTLVWAEEAPDEAVELAEYVLRNCVFGDTTLEIMLIAVSVLVYADRLDRAEHWTSLLSKEASDRHAITWQALLGCISAQIWLRKGDLDNALAEVSRALGMLNTQSWGVLIGLPLSVLLRADAAVGRQDTAMERAFRSVPDDVFQTVFGLQYLHGRGHAHLAAGQIFAARRDFEACGALMKQWNMDFPTFIPWRSDLAATHLLTDNTATARDLAAEQLDHPAGIGVRTKGITLRVLAATCEPRQRLALLREAVDCLQRCGDRLELARALADLSKAHHQLGEFGRASTIARRAAEEAKTCHADELIRHLAAQPTADLDHRASVKGLALLSEAERRVATLAAMGHTNREIGRRLCITVSTVEQHLTRIYRKLHVDSRAGLPIELYQDNTPAEAVRR